MAEILCVYPEVQVLKKAAAKSNKPDKPVAIVSYDEKPGIQAIATTAPDLPPEPLASTRPSRVITQNANLARRPSSRPLRVHLHAQAGLLLNLIEGFFSKFARSVLPHLRVASKQELKRRIMAGIEDVNRCPVIHTWSYKLTEAA